MRTAATRLRPLSNAEQRVMDHVWANGPVTAEACREALAAVWPMKESTMRTVLRRLEAKGYLTHETEGRTYVYRAVEQSAMVSTRTVRHLIDRFWAGSAEAFVAGLVDHAVLTPAQLERLSRRIASQKGKRR